MSAGNVTTFYILLCIFINNCPGKNNLMSYQSLHIFLSVDGGCYFPVEVQGEYVTQSMIDSEIAYTSVTIAYNSIPGAY